MKISDVVITEHLEKRDRNFKIVIQSPVQDDGNFLITCDREIVFTKNGNRFPTDQDEQYQIIKRFSEIASDIVTLPPEAGGITLTAGQVALALEMITDKYARGQ